MNNYLWSLTNSLSHKHGTSDPFEIAKKLCISINWLPLGTYPLGKVSHYGKIRFIILNDKLKRYDKKYFVLAHELGHFLLHGNLNKYEAFSCFTHNHLEVEANRFAEQLLFQFYIEQKKHIPLNWNVLEEVYGFPSIQYYFFYLLIIVKILTNKTLMHFKNRKKE